MDCEMVIDGEEATESLLVAICKANISLCGSRVTCNPPPVGTDVDYLVEIEDSDSAVMDVVGILTVNGYKLEGTEHYQSAVFNFMSWRKGSINLIVTRSEAFATKHRVATAVCRRLNILNKADRIAVFQAILYGIAPTEFPLHEVAA